MGWKECDQVSLRVEFVQLASVEGANIAELCRRFEISRKTGYKWLARWKQLGPGGLLDQSRRPVNSPHQTPGEAEQAVLKVRSEHRSWGGRKIREVLLQGGLADPPSASTITQILHRHDLVTSAATTKAERWTRFERGEPNELWQVDFKGEFKVSAGGWCYPLTLLDDHSRFSLGVFGCGNQQRTTVKARFREVFERYGIPRSVYVDNGNPWGTKGQEQRHTRFTAWLLRHDISVIHGQPCHPQGRGKLERFHRTLKLEVLQDQQFASLRESQAAFDTWRNVYNLERPHEALAMAVPASRYRVSERQFEERTRAYEYSARFEVRHPNRYGQFSFHGTTYKVSEAFGQQPLGLAASGVDGIWDVYFCRFPIAVLDEHTQMTRGYRASDRRPHQPQG